MLVSCGGGSEKLAAPGDVPAGLETLKLTEGQAKDINAWLASTPSPDPSELAEYVESVLWKDQKEAFDKLMKSHGSP